MATSLDNAIPRNSYLFGASWPHVCRTLLAAVEQNGDPYAVMVPTAEIILSEAAIGVASTHSGFRAEPPAADYSGA